MMATDVGLVQPADLRAFLDRQRGGAEVPYAIDGDDFLQDRRRVMCRLPASGRLADASAAQHEYLLLSVMLDRWAPGTFLLSSVTSLTRDPEPWSPLLLALALHLAGRQPPQSVSPPPPETKGKDPSAASVDLKSAPQAESKSELLNKKKEKKKKSKTQGAVASRCQASTVCAKHGPHPTRASVRGPLLPLPAGEGLRPMSKWLDGAQVMGPMAQDEVRLLAAPDEARFPATRIVGAYERAHCCLINLYGLSVRERADERESTVTVFGGLALLDTGGWREHWWAVLQSPPGQPRRHRRVLIEPRPHENARWLYLGRPCRCLLCTNAALLSRPLCLA